MNEEAKNDPASQDFPSWLTRLSPHGRQLVARILEHFGASAVLAQSREGATRQARHAKFGRARTTAVAGALLLAPVDEELAQFVLSAEFAQLRPYNADIQTKWPYLIGSVKGLTQAGCERLFDQAAALFLDVGSRMAELPDSEVLRIFNAVTVLLGGPLVFGAAFRERAAALSAEAERRGLLQNLVLQLRVAYLQSWAGDDTRLLELLLDPACIDTRIADGYLFVRSDTRPEVFETCVALMRAGSIDPDRTLLRSHPEATLVQALDFTLTRLRDSAHLRMPGYLLMLLTTVLNVRDHARSLHARGLLRDGLTAVNERVTRFARVQVMEKRRYAELLEAMPDGPAKDRLSTLWSYDFSGE